MPIDVLYDQVVSNGFFEGFNMIYSVATEMAPPPNALPPLVSNVARFI